jgi:metabolite-proton symporter
MANDVGDTGTPGVDGQSLKRIALISLSGAAIEWYDFFIFATAAALVFGPLFFPTDDPLVSTLLSFSTFAVAFLARPLGGVVWGHFGDRLGRKEALVAALLTMGVATTLIGLLPTYATIGVLAPIILVILRFAQGLAVGGQWGGAVLIATESAPRNRRGFYGSFAQVGVPAGVILANGAFLAASRITSPETFAAWGWRVPFLASAVLIAVALYAQLRLEDTPAFKHLIEAKAQQAPAEAPAEEYRSPITEAIFEYPRNILLAAGAFIAINGTGYVFFAYILSYGTSILGLTQTTMLIGVLVGSASMIPFLMGAASLSDRVGRRKVFLTGVLLLGLWSFPFFLLVNTGSVVLITLSLALGLIFLGIAYGPMGAMFTEMFSTKVRYSGASLGYQVGAILGGGFAPIIATSLLAATGSWISISVYMVAICIISFASILLITETYQVDVDEAMDEERHKKMLQEAEGRASS